MTETLYSILFDRLMACLSECYCNSLSFLQTQGADSARSTRRLPRALTRVTQQRGQESPEPRAIPGPGSEDPGLQVTIPRSLQGQELRTWRPLKQRILEAGLNTFVHEVH